MTLETLLIAEKVINAVPRLGISIGERNLPTHPTAGKVLGAAVGYLGITFLASLVPGDADLCMYAVGIASPVLATYRYFKRK